MSVNSTYDLCLMPSLQNLFVSLSINRNSSIKSILSTDKKIPSHCEWCWIRFIMHYFRRYFVENPNSIDPYIWLFAILAHFKVNSKTNFGTHLYAWSFWPENTNRHFDWENASLNGILLCSKAFTRNTKNAHNNYSKVKKKDNKWPFLGYDSRSLDEWMPSKSVVMI